MNDYDWERLYQEAELKRFGFGYVYQGKKHEGTKGNAKKGKLELVTADIARSATKRLTTAETDKHGEEEDVVLQQIGNTDSDGECNSSSDGECNSSSDGDDDLEEIESGNDIASLFSH